MRTSASVEAGQEERQDGAKWRGKTSSGAVTWVDVRWSHLPRVMVDGGRLDAEHYPLGVTLPGHRWAARLPVSAGQSDKMSSDRGGLADSRWKSAGLRDPSTVGDIIIGRQLLGNWRLEDGRI